MQQLITWLHKPSDYSIGVLLYDQYGDNSFLKKQFAKGFTPFNQKKLIEELKKVAAKENPRVNVWTETVSGFKSLPQQVQSLKMEMNTLFKQARDLHSRLKTFASKKERSDAGFIIIENFEKIALIKNQLQYYEQHNKLPEKTESDLSLDNMSIAELKLKRATVRTFVSKGMHEYKEVIEEINKKIDQLNAKGTKG